MTDWIIWSATAKIPFLYPSENLIEVLFLSCLIFFLSVFTRVCICVDICTMVFLYCEVFYLSRIAVNFKFCRVKRDTTGPNWLVFWRFLPAYIRKMRGHIVHLIVEHRKFFIIITLQSCSKHFGNISQESKTFLFLEWFWSTPYFCFPTSSW